MKYASDFRSAARNALKGKWGLAVGAGFVAAIFGAASNNGGIHFNFDASADLDAQIPLDPSAYGEEFMPYLFAFLATVLISSLVVSLVYFLVGSVVSVGYACFNLSLIDGKQASVNQLFSFFSSWGKGVAAEFLRTIYTLLWSLLFIIPGIIASYSYAMTSYILAEHPELSANEAIKKSKEIMSGNRGRLFCLHLSFIGWEILNVFTCGIGSLWLNPYRNAATADFYREITGSRPEEEESTVEENAPIEEA
jgi:uncharacterized membrane protein